jgi:hypothetical protein
MFSAAMPSVGFEAPIAIHLTQSIDIIVGDHVRNELKELIFIDNHISIGGEQLFAVRSGDLELERWVVT